MSATEKQNKNANTSRGPQYIQTGDARCIIDTGASDHIMSRRYLTKKESKSIRKAPYALQFRTANDVTHSGELVDAYVKDLDISITAWLLMISHHLFLWGSWSKTMTLNMFGPEIMVQCSVSKIGSSNVKSGNAVLL